MIPVFNESRHIARTIEEAAAAAAGGGFATEFIVVDDGSTDGTGDVAESLRVDAAIQVVRQPNRGRIAARRAGLAAATGEYTMFLDGRVRLEPDGLAFISRRLDKGERVWNSHVTIDTAGNPYGKFWKVLVNLAWPDYLARPRTMSFGARDFDRYPKGTAGFIAPTELM
ncbi:MAG: glycosyltransferase family 2 protein [Candidatus Dormibacteria bacterium]